MILFLFRYLDIYAKIWEVEAVRISSKWKHFICTAVHPQPLTLPSTPNCHVLWKWPFVGNRRALISIFIFQHSIRCSKNTIKCLNYSVSLSWCSPLCPIKLKHPIFGQSEQSWVWKSVALCKRSKNRHYIIPNLHSSRNRCWTLLLHNPPTTPHTPVRATTNAKIVKPYHEMSNTEKLSSVHHPFVFAQVRVS